LGIDSTYILEIERTFGGKRTFQPEVVGRRRSPPGSAISTVGSGLHELRHRLFGTAGAPFAYGCPRSGWSGSFDTGQMTCLLGGTLTFTPELIDAVASIEIPVVGW
jgi:hypothetical protein